MDFVADVPILRQKLASAATDALRLLKLEAEGYRCDATELIDPEDTPKNVMLRAERRKNFDPASPDAEKARNRYLAAAAFLFGERIPARSRSVEDVSHLRLLRRRVRRRSALHSSRT